MSWISNDIRICTKGEGSRKNLWNFSRWIFSTLDLKSKKIKISDECKFSIWGRGLHLFWKTDISEYTWKNRFFKIKKDLLQTEFPNYQTFFAEDLERYYFEHLQSKEDSIYLDRLENEGWKECGPDYSYSLIRRKVILQVFWKVNSTCPKLSNFQGKKYKVRFDLETGKVENWNNIFCLLFVRRFNK